MNGKFVCLSHFVKNLKEFVRQTKQRQESTTIGAYFRRSRLVVRGLFLWTLHDGRSSRIEVVLKFSDKFFLIIFILELVLNLYVHWM